MTQFQPCPVEDLQEKAKTLRRHIIKMIAASQSGHPGGSLSAVEIISALYFNVLRHDPKNPEWLDRDRFVLSKGHAAPALYAALAECGYFPVDELTTLRKMDSRMQGHCEVGTTPGVEMSTGPLGQGLSFGVGCALAARLDERDSRVYVLLGDGELNEGQVWEAAMSAAHFKIDNLVAIVDRNSIQLDGWTHDIMETEPLAQKWRAFGWRVSDVAGHDIDQLLTALEKAKTIKGKPTVIIARTIKGKGVSFMENKAEFHGKAPTPEQAEQALKELE
ncbi:MAG: transketolase [Dehalococcoidia bacterium]